MVVGAKAHIESLQQMPSAGLCRKIAEHTGGVCFLGFSRGKDSVAAFIQLKKHFERVIPFHCASVPHVGFVDESLEYYERFFDCEILRYMDGDCMKAAYCSVFQPPGCDPLLNDVFPWCYDKHDIINIMQRKFNLPNAWCAFGINASDSIDRHIYVNKNGGINLGQKTFYPCYDWKKADILTVIEESGVKLARDYILANRSMAAVPKFRHLAKMINEMPGALEKIEEMFPMIKAEICRYEFIKNRSQELAKG